MPLLYDHVPFTRAPGAHPFGPRDVPDGITKINFTLARCTLARPELWDDPAIEIALGLFLSIDGGPVLHSGGTGNVAVDALSLYETGTTVAQLIAMGKLAFGPKGGRYVNWRGVEEQTTFFKCPLQPGINRVVTGVLAVRGGTLVTELTLEVL